MKTKNKNIFRTVQWLLFIAAAIFFCTYLTSCNSSKRTIESSFFKVDSIVANNSRTNIADTYSSRSIERKDTAVTFPFKHVTATFTPLQMQPLYTKEGKPQPRTYRIDTNGIRAIVTAMIDGSISVTCEADSLKIVVQTLTRITDSLIKNATATTDISMLQKSEERMSYSEFFKKTGSWFGRNWLLILIIIGFFVIVEIIFKRTKS